MKHWMTTTFAIGLSLLNACASNPPNHDTSTEAALIAESNRFHAIKNGAITQLANNQPGTIPLHKMPALLKSINDARNEATTANAQPIPAFQNTFVLEASQVVELEEISTAKSNSLKGLIVLGAATTTDHFDWVMAAVVNLETWEALDVKFNTNFGTQSRTLKPQPNTFTTLNDYNQMIGNAKNSNNYASRYNLRRVYIPQHNEKPNLERGLSAFKAYLPATTPNKRFVVNENRTVYRITPDTNTSELQTTSSETQLQKVGDLQ